MISGVIFCFLFPLVPDCSYRTDIGAFSASHAKFRVNDGNTLRGYLNGPDRAFANTDLASDAAIRDNLGGFNPFFISGHALFIIYSSPSPRPLPQIGGEGKGEGGSRTVSRQKIPVGKKSVEELLHCPFGVLLNVKLGSPFPYRGSENSFVPRWLSL